MRRTQRAYRRRVAMLPACAALLLLTGACVAHESIPPTSADNVKEEQTDQGLALQPVADPQQPPSRSIEQAQNLADAFTRVAELVSPSVVSLRVESVNNHGMQLPFRFFGEPMPQQPQIQQGAGSGVIVRSDGYILTNNHVVNEATRIEVELQDGRRVRGEVVGTDPATDLAVVRIPVTDLPAIHFANPDTVRPGQWAVAIGSPFGLDYTVTTGVVSAVGRSGLGVNEIEDYIQTDASINPGNSGGPLVNLRGELVGINTMIVGRGSGIGFAVPAEVGSRVAEQLITHQRVRRAWLGVTFQELTPELAVHFNTPADVANRGALIASVLPGSPAAQAGLEPGDIVTAVNGAPVRESHDLLRAVLRHDIGEEVQLAVIRRGEVRQHTVELAERPADAANAGRSRRPAPSHSEGQRFGMELAPVPEQMRGSLDLPRDQGVAVVGVHPGSPAARAGLQRGDVIVEVAGTAVDSPETVKQALAQPAEGGILVRVRRGHGAYFALLENPDG